jgi:hypothetical protein
MQKNLQFAPGQIRATQKVDATTDAARTILGAEAAAREAKTARLRELRLSGKTEAAGASAAAQG